jgi:hypothetical protein
MPVNFAEQSIHQAGEPDSVHEIRVHPWFKTSSSVLGADAGESPQLRKEKTV